jgi:hypothetical protein
VTGVIDPVARIRHILGRALEGCTFEAFHREGERALVLDSRRNGAHVGLRFLGLKTLHVDGSPEKGERLRLLGVSNPDGLLRTMMPAILRGPGQGTRVRIEAGKAKLEIVCEDVEWWED